MSWYYNGHTVNKNALGKILSYVFKNSEVARMAEREWKREGELGLKLTSESSLAIDQIMCPLPSYEIYTK